jgi:dolichyl-phosphate-mannose-protein mannosyltransferase
MAGRGPSESREMSQQALLSATWTAWRVEAPAILWAVVLILWLAIQVIAVRPAAIATDWNGWRQADTQSIALTFAEQGIDPLHPRVAWGGDGSGLVEAEVQIYPALIAVLLRLFGIAEWPGQVISSVAWAAAATCLLFPLRRRFGWTGALFGAGAMLGSSLAMFLSTSVMPDPTALALYCLGLTAFLEFLESGRRRWLLAATASFALAALTKPTALNLGIVQFVLVLLTRPRLFRSPALWLSWATVLGLVALGLWHGHQNYLASGNSFGVVSPGTDLKFPTLSELLNVTELGKAGWISVVECFGPVGVAAALWLLLRNRITAEEIALAIGAGAALVISLRYSANQPHYHLFTVPLAGWLVAHAASIILGSRRSAWTLPLAATAFLAVGYLPALHERVSYSPGERVGRLAELARQLRSIAGPDDLIVVRSLDRAYDPRYKRRNNYEDPRAFYVSGLRGWAVPRDRTDLEKLAAYAGRGARYYLEVKPRLADPALESWLNRHGEVLVDDEHGIIVRISSRGGDASL